ncbi:unnamed protein product [Caenorhabditis auriculariae]|uniref:Galectin n=1 Tax=Caenorhabditis auriculariae TaxID=2777116 RepID=A0A8S1H2T1_9PELO|nr:unnamed protein product [Caenorhabditis auriculariae]
MKVLLAFIGLLPLASALGIRCYPYNNKTDSKQVFPLENPLKVGDVIYISAYARVAEVATHFVLDLYEGSPTAQEMNKNISLRIMANLDTSQVTFNTITPDFKYLEEPKKSPITRSAQFKLKLLVRDNDYQIFINLKKVFYTYNFRRPSLNIVKAIGLQGIKFSATLVCPSPYGVKSAGESQTIAVDNGNVYYLYGPTLQGASRAPYTNTA